MRSCLRGNLAQPAAIGKQSGSGPDQTRKVDDHPSPEEIARRNRDGQDIDID